MEEKLICPICGEATRAYMGNARKDRLCGKHADMLKKEEIKVDDKGLFINSKTGKVMNKDYVEKKPEKSIEKQINKENEKEDTKTDSVIVKCLGCGKETRFGNLFCTSCYYKYKDKQLLVRITKCKEVELLDESYEGNYICKDGHIVKSKSEREIDNYLFDHRIPHAYEKSVSIDADPEHDLHPDFYLPNFNGNGDVYIEHWGFNSNNKDYTKSRNYKVEKYKELGLTIVCTNEKDQNDVAAALDRKLKFFKNGEINFNEE